MEYRIKKRFDEHTKKDVYAVETLFGGAWKQVVGILPKGFGDAVFPTMEEAKRYIVYLGGAYGADADFKIVCGSDDD